MPVNPKTTNTRALMARPSRNLFWFRMVLVKALAIWLSGAAAAAARETIDFDAGWRFFRGDVSGAEAPGFNDKGWRTLDVPHDWSIEDLPAKPTQVPELEAVTGEWRFHPGDDPQWRNPRFDDSGWRRVVLPEIWENHGQSKNDGVYGWFRRRMILPADCRGTNIDLLLGKIDDVDETWVNGQRVGGTGSFPPAYRWADQEQRRYRVPASLVGRDGAIVIAVRVFDGANNGGIHEAGVTAARVGPFDPLEAGNRHFTGFTIGGTGWYRKHFTLDRNSKYVTVEFDGIYMNSEVWINGRRLGEHPHGYTGFAFDLTPHLKPAGTANVLAVKVRNEGRNSRWYSGSGIYRHTRLVLTDAVRVTESGLFVATPEVSPERARVTVSTEVANHRPETVDAGIRVRILDATRRVIATADGVIRLNAGETAAATQTVTLSNPALWSLTTPVAHTAEADIVVAGRVADSASVRFGIRRIEADAQRGFLLNGERVRLRGGCIHHDNGPLGACAIDRAEERKIELLKANGFNAVRTSHNPPSPALLDACDRLGMLVIVEAFDQWNESKEMNGEDYHRFFRDWHVRDLTSMVRTHRNHPSVIMWSVGNEIPEQFRAGDIGDRLRKIVLAQDATRFVTQAICSDWGNVARDWDRLSDPAFTHLDIAGYNYLPDKYESDHARHPERVMYGSESYPKDALRYWSAVETHPYLIGDFVWTAMDYLGEAGIAHSLLSNRRNTFFMGWPWTNAWCGDLDLCGFKKPQSYYRDVVWRRREIALAVHRPIPDGLSETLSAWAWPDETDSWNWQGSEGRPMKVALYTRCEAVRLELNGRVIGEKPAGADAGLTTTFEVPYEPGRLVAHGLRGGEVVSSAELATTGPVAGLRLTPDRGSIRADRGDLCYVTIEVVDKDGNRVPDADVPLRFSVSGAGELAGHANGVPNESMSFRAPTGKTSNGRCLAILRPDGRGGRINFEVAATGISPASLTVIADPSPQPAVP